MLLGVLALAGLGALGNAVGWLVAAGLLALIALAASPDPVKAYTLELLGSVVVAIATLVGFNVVTDWAIHELGLYEENSWAGWIVVGLLVGFAVFSVAAWAYLRRRGHWAQRRALIAAPVAAFLFIFVTPYVYAWIEGEEEKPVPRQVVVGSEIDVLIVADHGRRPAAARLPELPQRSGFDVRYSVGFAHGETVRWTLSGGDEAAALAALSEPGGRVSGAPQPRPESDRVLLLLPDPTPAAAADPAALPDEPAERGEIRRWQAVARSARTPDTPAYALLQTRQERRLANWRKLRPRRIREVSLQLLGSRLLTDVGFRLAIAAPTANEDFLLAEQHRPILLFDTEEPVPRPLSIEALFRDEKIRECPLRGRCEEPVRRPEELRNGDTRLELDRPRGEKLASVARNELRVLQAASVAVPEPADDPTAAGAAPAGLPPAADPVADEKVQLPGEPLSTIYVHPVPREVNGRNLLYLDYWWYLPDNPARAGGGAFCGAALVIPGISCFNHESDWEGITVVVDRTPDDDGVVRPRPVAVHYAEHSSVVRYGWQMLHDRWAASENRDGRYTRFVGDAGLRPLVFVARGTHAGYPFPCRSACKQTVGALEEQPRDGLLPWAGNGATTCGTDTACLTALPTRSGGNRAALWNAFEGPWGKARCVLKYCNSTNPPSAPGQQGRYRRPWSCSGEAKLERGRLRYTKGAASCQNG